MTPNTNEFHQYIQKQRWYRDKNHSLQSLNTLDSLSHNGLTFVVLEAIYDNAPSSIYFTLINQDNPSAHPQNSQYCQFLNYLTQKPVTHTSQGYIQCHNLSPIDNLTVESTHMLPPEQSNTLIQVNNHYLFKVYHQPTTSRESNILQHLNQFSSPLYPQIFANITYTSERLNINSSISLIEQFIPNQGNLWNYLPSLSDHNQLSIIQQLGKDTAQMHTHLQQFTQNKYWSLKNIDLYITNISHLISDLQNILDNNAIYNVQSKLQNIYNHFSLTSNLTIPILKTHGDYHLGQVLIDTDSNLFIIDFEGEPSQTREYLLPAQQDVTSMVRSLEYYQDCNNLSQDLTQIFVNSYYQHTSSNESLYSSHLFDLCYLYKLLYEIKYELNNRPNWLHIPLNKFNNKFQHRN